MALPKYFSLSVAHPRWMTSPHEPLQNLWGEGGDELLAYKIHIMKHGNIDL
jgi:hypothetical protein